MTGEQRVGYYRDLVTGSSSKEKGAREVQRTPGVGDASMVLGVVIKHVDYPQKKEARLQVTASGAAETEEVRHMFSGGSGARMRQPKQVRGNPLHNAAEWKVLKAVSSALEIAKPAVALLLESSECGPSVEQSIKQDDSHPGWGAGPGLA